MGSRTHDFHCPACHVWISGFEIGDDMLCPCGTRMFYDLNNEAECCVDDQGNLRL